MLKNKINPLYISGFTQADGSFSITIKKGKKKKLYFTPRFSITQLKKEKILINNIKEYFGVGYIRELKKDKILKYEVNKITELQQIIIPHFEKYPLKGGKLDSFNKFKYIVEKVFNKEHYNENEFINILSLIPNMNHPFINKKWIRYLDSTTIELIKNKKFEINNNNISSTINIEFIKGLFDGDGSISIYLQDNKYIRITFSIVQHKTSKIVLDEIKDFLKCGNIYEIKKDIFRYDVKNLKDIKNIVLPIFKNHSLHTKNQKWIEIENILQLKI